jgi:outer membrane protein assembly factor BamB
VSLSHRSAVIWTGLFCLVNACGPSLLRGPVTQERAWPGYLGSAQRSSASNEILSADPQVIWRTAAGRGIVGAPALSEDVIAVSLVDRQVALLDRVTGAVLWRHRIGQHVGAGPLISDDRVLVGTRDERGRVYALRLETGAVIWSRSIGEIAAPLAIERETIYAATLAGNVAAIRLADGRQLWSARVPGGVRAAPVPAGEGLIVATTSDSLFLLDRETGRVVSRRATSGTVLGAPALVDSLLVTGSSDGTVEVVEARTLRLLAARRLDGAVVGHVSVRSRSVHILTAPGTLWTLGLPLLAESATIATGAIARAGPQPLHDGVLVGAVNGELTLYSRTGQRAWNLRLASAIVEPPLVDSRSLVVTTQRGEVLLFR